MLRFFICGLLISVATLLRAAESMSADASSKETARLAYAMSTRYAPFADWEAFVELEPLVGREVGTYWRSADALRAARAADALPLAGLRLALDPGHVGGQWAKYEGRDFRINEGDFRVREGELVLIVANLLREQLEALGAEVLLLRESHDPINPKPAVAYLQQAQREVPRPETNSFEALMAYGEALRDRAIRLCVVTGELVERARVVNHVIQPDALISLHINAAAWPPQPVPAASESLSRSAEGASEAVRRPQLQLVDSNNVHVLIFGCLSEGELSSPRQQQQLLMKLSNASGPAEIVLGKALGRALEQATHLPPAVYSGKNAVLLDSDAPSLWARNLLLLRMVECPTALLEPYVANSKAIYPRIQAALAARASGSDLPADDILVEYADAVAAGILQAYGGSSAAGATDE